MPEHRIRRVLMTGDTVGGVWTYALELAAALNAYGVEVVLATMGGEATAEQKAEAAAIPNLQLFTSRYKLEWMENPWSDVEASREWLLDLERRFSPDVIHLNSFGHGGLPFRAPALLTVHSCVLSWWAAIKGTPVPGSWNRYREAVKNSLRMVRLLTTPSQAMLQALRIHYGADLPTCRVVPNGRNRARYKTAPKERFVLSAGRLWDESKNMVALLQAAASLPWPVYLAGEHRNPNGEALDLPGCRHLGNLSAQALAEWYARAPVYALPARYEPFGLSALEAGLSGCALVLGDIESLREVWEDAALFVPPDDSYELARTLRKLMANPALREEMSQRSMARAVTFTPERMASGYLAAYREVAAPQGMACAS